MKHRALRHIILTGDETPDDLRQAIANLRAHQRKTPIPSTKDELNEDINAVFDMLADVLAGVVVGDGMGSQPTQ